MELRVPNCQSRISVLAISPMQKLSRDPLGVASGQKILGSSSLWKLQKFYEFRTRNTKNFTVYKDLNGFLDNPIFKISVPIFYFSDGIFICNHWSCETWLLPLLSGVNSLWEMPFCSHHLVPREFVNNIHLMDVPKTTTKDFSLTGLLISNDRNSEQATSSFLDSASK